LDGIRGIAVLLVLFLHLFASSMEDEKWTGLPRVVLLATRFGGVGNDLFFVLSGFLITGILLDSVGRPHYFRIFYIRRALRILPLYYLILLLIGMSYRGAGGFVGLSIFYLSNMAPIFGVAVVYPPLWSLSVEEHFYLLWPWLISRLRPPQVWLLAAGICLAEPVLRGFAFFKGWDVATYSWFRFDGLAAGALLATFVRSGGGAERRLWGFGSICLVAAGILAAVGFPFGIFTRKTLAGAALLYTFYSMLFVGIIAVVLSRQSRHLSGIIRSRILRWCGNLSYCLYMVHWLIIYGWDRLIGKYPSLVVDHWGRFGAICIRGLTVGVVCFVLAELSRCFFEGPLLRLKEFFAYS